MPNSATIRMEVGDLKDGIYFVTLRAEGREQVVKFIKQ